MNNQKFKIMKTLDNFSANKLQSQDLAKTKGGGCAHTMIMFLFDQVEEGGWGHWVSCGGGRGLCGMVFDPWGSWRPLTITW